MFFYFLSITLSLSPPPPKINVELWFLPNYGIFQKKKNYQFAISFLKIW